MIKTLPWEYGVRNLLRRPSRSLLTLMGLFTVILLIFVVVGFIRGLEASLAASGDTKTVLVYSLSSGADIENSAIPARTPSLLSASLDGLEEQRGITFVSPEIYIGTKVEVPGSTQQGMALVRGVTPQAPLIRSNIQLIEGEWPQAGEVMVGRLAHSKVGCDRSDLAIGNTVNFDNRTWRICGTFAADGSAFESEIWAPLTDLQSALKRQDLSLVAVKMSPSGSVSDVEIFCQERLDLELKAVPEAAYYASLQQHYKPVRVLGWVVVFLIAGAGVFAGLNTMYGAVVGRVRELATLQAMGFRRRAILFSLIQEAILLSVGASLLAAMTAKILLDGSAVRFTMGAFVLRIDGLAIAIGCSVGLTLGLVGAIPPALKAMRQTVSEGVKAI